MDATVAALLILYLFLLAHSIESLQENKLIAFESRTSHFAEAISYSENEVDGGGEYCLVRFKENKVVFCGAE